jgi:hypothetical protein
MTLSLSESYNKRLNLAALRLPSIQQITSAAIFAAVMAEKLLKPRETQFSIIPLRALRYFQIVRFICELPPHALNDE